MANALFVNYEYLKPKKQSIKSSALKHCMVRYLVTILYSANLHMTKWYFLQFDEKRY